MVDQHLKKNMIKQNKQKRRLYSQAAGHGNRSIRIVMWGTFDLGKPRVRILERGLKDNGIEIIRCHRDLWTGIEDKSQIRGKLYKLFLMVKWLSAYPKLIFQYLKLPDHDAVLVPYFGHLDVLVIWSFAKLRGIPIVWDSFISIYNTIIEDRRLISLKNPLSCLIWNWEWLSCRAADHIVTDTLAHAQYFAKTYGLTVSKFVPVFVGAEPEAFPLIEKVPNSGGSPIVLFYGQFIPLHGIDTIIQAAHKAKDEPIRWVIIGRGQDEGRIRDILQCIDLPKLSWIPWVNYQDLSYWLSQASVCLGIFGDTNKAAMVIPNKVFQILMSGKPLITRDSPAIRELIKQESPGVWLVPPDDPQALLESVRSAIRESMHQGLHCLLRDRIAPSSIGADLLANINL